ncbi:MAG: hypothetical protein CL669_02175 [Balneola sp.]|nr:hypothetical protein [Balneola sp.]
MVIYRTLEYIQQHFATDSQASSQAVFDVVSTDVSPSKQEERILYLDVGSSYLKLGIWSEKNSEFLVRSVSWEEGEEVFSRIFKQFFNQGIECIVGSVVYTSTKERLSELFKLLGEYFHFDVVWIDHTTLQGLDLRINYSPVHNLGLDRLIACYGVRAYRSGPVVVVDLGSAVTVDSLSETHFQGGIIAPGLRAIQAGMQQITPHLPTPSGDNMLFDFPPKSTQNALWWGQYAFWVAGIEGMILEISRATRTQEIILTGGDANWFFEAIHHQRRIDLHPKEPVENNEDRKLVRSLDEMKMVIRPHLVLEGLRYLSRKSNL